MSKFLVLEGLDGSGKTTQLQLLRSYLEQKHIKYKDLHFPMLNNGYYGTLIASFLRGEFGDIHDVHPRLVAMLFAEDRKEHIHTMKFWQEKGYMIIADRYVNSNIAFQCAKLDEVAAQKELRDWILKFEYEHNLLPKADAAIFLDVPMSAVKKSLSNNREGADRAYLQGKKDIHEQSLDFQEKVRNIYLQTVDYLDDFHRVGCFDSDSNFLSKEAIHKKLIKALGIDQ